MHRPPTAATDTATELAALRPGLADAFTAELPGARAAVLTRLWRALAHEPLPWITRRAAARGALTLFLADGRRLRGPAADPYATAAYVGEVLLGGSVYDDPARLMTDLAVPHGAAFAVELAHSVSSLALSRAGQTHAADPAAQGWPTTDWEWEQRVVDGHPFHPNCRYRPGFSVAEELAYGPEHRPVVRLGAVAVAAGECLVSGEWPDDLRDGGALLLPVHPWQARHVLRRTAADLTDAHPLMSLRTLALPGGPHVKTALSARLTSSVRDISVASVTSSAALSAFAETLAERTDGLLHITRTLGAATADSPDLAAVLRESPQAYVRPGSGERVLPVAALATTELPASPVWLASFTRLALTVGLRLLELGVALEAHGQNLLVVLSARGEPLRLVYRDLADLRISPARLARHGARAPEVPPRMLTDDVATLRRKLFGALVAGALAGTAGSRAALGAAMAASASDLPHTGDLVPLLHEDVPAKALTLMRLSPGTPGDRWTRLPNPLL